MHWWDVLAGGGSALLLQIMALMFSRTDIMRDRREKDVKRMALEAARDSGEFALTGEQQLMHYRIDERLAEINTGVKTLDKKLDDLIFNGFRRHDS